MGDVCFNFGELLLMYDIVSSLPHDMVLRAGESTSGVKYGNVKKSDLLKKIEDCGKHIENSKCNHTNKGDGVFEYEV